MLKGSCGTRRHFFRYAGGVKAMSACTSIAVFAARSRCRSIPDPVGIFTDESIAFRGGWCAHPQALPISAVQAPLHRAPRISIRRFSGMRTLSNGLQQAVWQGRCADRPQCTTAHFSSMKHPFATPLREAPRAAFVRLFQPCFAAFNDRRKLPTVVAIHS